MFAEEEVSGGGRIGFGLASLCIDLPGRMVHSTARPAEASRDAPRGCPAMYPQMTAFQQGFYLATLTCSLCEGGGIADYLPTAIVIWACKPPSFE